MAANGWRELREERLAHGGAFAWFMQCREHGTNSQFHCLSCDFIGTHNEQIWRELAAENGWLVDEPAGDVPLTP
jgi:hypothetical protein